MTTGNEAAGQLRIYLQELKLAGYRTQLVDCLNKGQGYSEQIGVARCLRYYRFNTLDISLDRDGNVLLWSEEARKQEDGAFIISPASIITSDVQKACAIIRLWLDDEGATLTDLAEYGTDEEAEGDQGCPAKSQRA